MPLWLLMFSRAIRFMPTSSSSSSQQDDVGSLLLDPHPPFVTVTTFNKQTTLTLDTHPRPSIINRTINSEASTTRIITTIPNTPTNNLPPFTYQYQDRYLHLGWINPLADYILLLLSTTFIVLMFINSNMLTLLSFFLIIGSLLVIMVCYLFEPIDLPIHPSQQNDGVSEPHPSRINLTNQQMATVLLDSSSNNENKSVEI